MCLYLLFFFVFWYHSPNFLDTPRKTCRLYLREPENYLPHDIK
jgi:hypothetical protein